MIDLHCHSTASDGTCSPLELAQAAHGAGLSACAITDHDTLEGIPEFVSQSSSACRLLPGIEISCAWYHSTIHILGLFIDPEQQELVELVSEIQSHRKNRNLRLLERLQRQGCEITFESVRKHSGGVVIARPHFAQALVDEGCCVSHDDAYRNFLSDVRLRDLPRWQILPERAIQAIHAAGGIASWAHPSGINRPPLSRVRRTSKELASKGLDALEALYSGHSPAQREAIQELASALSLKITGGSDFHGKNTPFLKLGVGRGDLIVPDSVLAQFQQTA